MSLKFGMGNTKPSKSNNEMAMVMYSLAFSDKGNEQLRRIFKVYSKSLIKKLEGFYAKLVKDKYFEEVSAREKETKASKTKGTESLKTLNQEQVRKVLDDFIAKIQDITPTDLLELKKIIDERYFVKGETLLLEGFILGFYDFLKDYFQDYYDIIEFKYKVDMEDGIQDKILREIDNNVWSSKEAIESKIGKKIEGLKTYDNSIANAVDYQRQLIEENKRLVIPFLTINDKELMNTLFPEERTLAKFLEKKIEPIMKTYEMDVTDRREEFDSEIFTLVENVVFDLLKFRKNVINKELYKSLVNG
jgi:hypothetical protein